MDEPSETTIGAGRWIAGAREPEPRPADARRGQRQSIFRLAAFRRAGEPDAVLRVRNLSAGGLMADCRPSLDVGETVELELRGVGAITARVAWAKRGRVGLAFASPIDPALVRRKVLGPVIGEVTIVRPTSTRPGRRPGLRIG